MNFVLIINSIFCSLPEVSDGSQLFKGFCSEPSKDVILDYNIYKQNSDGMITDHSFLTKGITGDSMDGLLPHINPNEIDLTLQATYNNFAGIFPKTKEISLKKEKVIKANSKKAKKKLPTMKKSKDLRLSVKLKNLQAKSLSGESMHKYNNFGICYPDNTDQASSSGAHAFSAVFKSTPDSIPNKDTILYGYLVSNTKNTNQDNLNNLESYNVNGKTSRKITFNSPNETNLFWKHLKSAKRDNLRNVYIEMCKNMSLMESSYVTKRFVNVFIQYYTYLKKLVKKCLDPKIANRIGNIEFKELQFSQITHFCLIEDIEVLKKKIVSNRKRLDIIKHSEKFYFDLETFTKLQNIIQKDDLEKKEYANFSEEIYYISKTVDFNIAASFSFSLKNIRELELFVIKEIQKMPKGVDSFMVTQSFIYNLTLTNCPLKHRQLFNLLYLVRRFITNESKRELTEDDYYKFIMALIRTGNSYMSATGLELRKFIYKKLFEIRFDLQNNLNCADKLVVLLGIIFPYNMNEFFLSITAKHLDQVLNQSPNSSPFSYLYTAPVYDTFDLLSQNGLLKV